MISHKHKFGVFLPFYAFQNKNPKENYSQLKTTVLECERLGYDAVWLDDHLMYRNWPISECWTTLATLAASTSKIRLGTMVTCSAHRNPALLAKTATTLDVLSEGRLEFGLGSGVQEAEHIAYGFSFPKPTVRTQQLREALEVIIRLWTEEKASYQGEYFGLKDAICEPKPLQKPHPPITIGGSGEKLTLKVTAQYADRYDWGFLPSIGEYKRKLGALEKYSKAINRSFSEIEKSCWPSGQILLAQTQSELNQKISKLKPAGMPLTDFKKSTLAVTPDECAAQLQLYTDLGVSYFMLYFADLPSTQSLTLFAQKVAKKIA